MPNLVDCWVKFTGSPKALQSLLEKPFDFESWIPEPEIEDNNTLYKWKKENWGATWISQDYSGEKAVSPTLHKQEDGSLVCTFITPWSPPLNFLWKLQEVLPGLSVEYEYSDYMACYCGVGTGPLEADNTLFRYESKEDIDTIRKIREWHVPICNPHFDT